MENGEQPQHHQDDAYHQDECSRVENGEQPQLDRVSYEVSPKCSRVENGEQPQLCPHVEARPT